jgi:hypothetical protein
VHVDLNPPEPSAPRRRCSRGATTTIRCVRFGSTRRAAACSTERTVERVLSGAPHRKQFRFPLLERLDRSQLRSTTSSAKPSPSSGRDSEGKLSDASPPFERVDWRRPSSSGPDQKPATRCSSRGGNRSSSMPFWLKYLARRGSVRSAKLRWQLRPHQRQSLEVKRLNGETVAPISLRRGTALTLTARAFCAQLCARLTMPRHWGSSS